jgi:hypothetical protein
LHENKKKQNITNTNTGKDTVNGNLTEEQRVWVRNEMGSKKIAKNKITDNRKEEIISKYSNRGNGPLREAVMIDGTPYFIKKSYNEKRNEYFITVAPKIEEATKVLRPPFTEEYPYTPYEFNDVNEPTLYLHRAIKETTDSLLQKIKDLVRVVNDIDDKTVTLLSANILGSYFQDRFSTVHYLIIVGDNGTGKSAFGDTFESLGYRAVNITNATEAFWFRIFGTNEPGQVTIVAEEVDKIDESSQIMGMLKVGYQPNAKVPRMNNNNDKMEFYYPFGIKILIAEKSPIEDRARGLLDRSFMIKSYKGFPDFSIKDIRNPQGNAKRQYYLDKIIHLRKLLLMYRLIHFKDSFKEVTVGLDGRDEELCKPLLQLFCTLGASEATQKELEITLEHFLNMKNRRKKSSIESLIYPALINYISENMPIIPTGRVWELISNSLEGEPDEKNHNILNSADYGQIYRNSLIRLICDKFGAEKKHERNGNVLIFDINYLAKMGKIYAETNGIQTKLVDDTISDNIRCDSCDSHDAFTEGWRTQNSSVVSTLKDTQALNSNDVPPKSKPNLFTGGSHESNESHHSSLFSKGVKDGGEQR